MREIILVMNGQVTKSYWKLIYGQINDTKHTKTFISRPFGNSLDLQLVGDLYFLHTEQESVCKKKNFAQRLKKKLFHIDFDGSVGKPETRLFFLGHRIALPCCGYSLESHWRCVFNEYPQPVVWRNKQNYPLIITNTLLTCSTSYVPSEDSDQLGHPSSLISVFAVRSLSH